MRHITDCEILIVDDNEQCQNLMKTFLDSSGLTVDCASSGDEALRMLVEKSFSFMITDYNMPGMNGLELARKACEMDPKLHIILVTGDSSPEIPHLAREVGICRMFCKPFSVSDILAHIQNVTRCYRVGCY